jgi:hypothetical protein
MVMPVGRPLKDAATMCISEDQKMPTTKTRHWEWWWVAKERGLYKQQLACIHSEHTVFKLNSKPDCSHTKDLPKFKQWQHKHDELIDYHLFSSFPLHCHTTQHHPYDCHKTCVSGCILFWHNHPQHSTHNMNWKIRKTSTNVLANHKANIAHKPREPQVINCPDPLAMDNICNVTRYCTQFPTDTVYAEATYGHSCTDLLWFYNSGRASSLQELV